MNKENNQISLNDRISKWLSNHIFIVFGLFVVLLTSLPFAFSRFSIIGYGEEAETIGNAINGLTAPIIGTFSALLVYLAFKSQLEANEKLNEANAKILAINSRQLYAAEFSMFKEKIEYFRKIRDINFINSFETVDHFIVTTGYEFEKYKVRAHKYLDRFNNQNSREMINELNHLHLKYSQISKSILEKDEINILLPEIIILKRIKSNIIKYRFDENFFLNISGNKISIKERYVRVINHIEKIDIENYNSKII